MKNEHYAHKLAAIYPDTAAAESAVAALESEKTADIKVMKLAPNSGDISHAIEPETQATRDTLVGDTLTGGAAGTAVGALAANAAAVAVPTLFVSAPIVGPLVVLGYGAMIGSTVGAIRGLKLQENLLAGLVKDALNAGYYAVIVHAENEAAHNRAKTIIDATLTEKTAHT